MRSVFCKYFLPVCGLSSHSLDIVFYIAEVFYFNEVQLINYFFDFPGGSDVKSICLQCRILGFDPSVGKIPWRREWQPTPVLLPRKPHEWRNLVGYSTWGCKESDTTERLHFHFHHVFNVVTKRRHQTKTGFEFFFVMDVKICVFFFFFLHMDHQLFCNHFLRGVKKNTVFAPLYSLCFLVKDQLTYVYVGLSELSILFH